MPLTHEIIYGGLVENNKPLPDTLKASLHITGRYEGNKSSFGITEEMLSKHLLLVGGTGSGKTNLFYHIVKQIKEIGRAHV